MTVTDWWETKCIEDSIPWHGNLILSFHNYTVLEFVVKRLILEQIFVTFTYDIMLHYYCYLFVVIVQLVYQGLFADSNNLNSLDYYLVDASVSQNLTF